MNLMLNRGDLKEESRNKEFALLDFDDFTTNAQDAIRRLDGGVFEEGKNLKGIYPPRPAPNKIADFIAGDEIYVSKMIGTHSISYRCKFESYKGGIVTAIATSCDPSWAWKSAENQMRVTARINKCYVRRDRKTVNTLPSVCWWFDKGGNLS